MIPTDPVKPADLRLTRQLHPGDRASADPDGRPYLARATDLLMDWYGVTAPQAETLITTWARECRRSPKAVAQVLVHQISQGDETYADTIVARTLENALRSLPGVVSHRAAAESGPIRAMDVDWGGSGRVTGRRPTLEATMSFDRPGLDDKHKTVSDTELNEALENDELEKGGLDFDEVEHDEGERSSGPEPNAVRRPPQEQDVTTGTEGRPVEPPD
jgi:hypothetical protein